eukprot:TRINITY_DN40778_c0_g1_i1.p1 TRINITY_DN40778_c0_g1~~TRINITY_DN40778_c0_g1_i1.p1  ORF type:complete len:556 (-),score=92.52 TRINITY_DN40778_c0_g1_i1:284-1951(-)
MQDRGTEKIWQWLGREEWACFGPRESHKIQHAYTLNKPGIDIWDGGSLRELDFVNMRALPGRQKIRYALPPPPPTIPVKKDKDKPGTKLPKVSASQQDTGTGAQSPESTLGGTIKLSEGDLALTQGTNGATARKQPTGLRALVHPCFLELQKPQFVFRNNTAEEDYQHFIWKRALQNCEDSTEFVVCLSEIYAELLDGVPRPELPVFGNSSQTMAALAIALHAAGASPWEQDSRYWYLSRRSQGSDTNPGSGPSPMGPPRKNMSTGNLKRAGTAESMAGLSRQLSMGSMSGTFGDMRLFNKTQTIKISENLSQCVHFRLEEVSANRAVSLKIVKAWHEWRAAAAAVDAAGIQQLQKVDGSYVWLTTSNEPESRLLRLGGACTTLWKTPGLNAASRVSLLSVSSRIAGGGGGPPKKDFSIRVEPGMSALDISIMQTKKKERAASMLICAVEKVGGGFLSGNFSGLEEDVAMRSDLYVCIREAGYQAERRRITDSRGRSVHIPEDGVLCCQDVIIFRGDRDDSRGDVHNFAQSQSAPVLQRAAADRAREHGPRAIRP